MAVWATEVGPVEAVGPGTPDPPVSAEADNDELAVAMPVDVRSEAKVFFYRLEGGT